MTLSRGCCASLAGALLSLGSLPLAQARETERVTVVCQASEANGASTLPSLDSKGRQVAFASLASNLQLGDTNGVQDVFVQSRRSGLPVRASVSSDGEQGNGASSFPALSGNGRYVVFESDADNLVPEDTNKATDVFVHDLKTGRTERVSVDSDGTQGDGDSSRPDISVNGRWVVFESLATNLVLADGNAMSDIFLHDRKSGITRRVSVASDGTEAEGVSSQAVISGNGQCVAFVSNAASLVPDDTNGVFDAYVHDVSSGLTERVSVDSQGNQASGDTFSRPALSNTGAIVAFGSTAPDLVADDTNEVQDAFVHARKTGATTRVSVDSAGLQGDGFSLGPVLSANGRIVAFLSGATNLVVGDDNAAFDIFVHDRKTAQTRRVSVDSDGNQSDGASAGYDISSSGRYVTFQSAGTNLVEHDNNGAGDVFLRDRK